MDLDHLLQIFALAEQKLLTLGMISKPFCATLQEEGEEGERKQQSPEEKPDPKKVWEQIHGVPQQTDSDEEAADERKAMALARKYSQMGRFTEEHPFKPGEKQALLDRARGKKSSPVAPWRQKLAQLKQSQDSGEKHSSILLPPEELPPEMLNDPKVSSIIKYGGGKDAKVIDFALDELATIRSMQGHELQDLDVNREIMVRDARKLYAPVIKYLEERRNQKKKE